MNMGKVRQKEKEFHAKCVSNQTGKALICAAVAVQMQAFANKLRSNVTDEGLRSHM